MPPMVTLSVYVDGQSVMSGPIGKDITANILVTSTGAYDTTGQASGTYTYSGSGTFLGLSTTQGALTPTYAVGDTFSVPAAEIPYYYYSVVSTTATIVLGNNVLTGVDTIKLTDANDETSTIDFTYGATPSGTISVKLGDTTLTGVNQVNVLGTDATYKSFGYVPVGYSVSGTHTGLTGCNQYYSIDNGTTWNIIPYGNFTLPTMTTFKLKIGGYPDTYSYVASTQLGLSMGAGSNSATSNNYTLTQNITDLQIDCSID